MKLTDVVYLVGSGLWSFGSSEDHDCSVYLIDGGEELALVDSGAGLSPGTIAKNIVTDGLPLDRVRYLFLTHGHADHAGGAAYLREKLNLQVMASHEIADAIRSGNDRALGVEAARKAGGYPPDYRFRPCIVDRELRGGDKIEVGKCRLSVIETPGHSRGCISFLMEVDERTYLFCGDTIFFGGKLALQNILDCDLQKSLDTIRRLGELSVDVFLPGHLCFSLSSGQRHIEAALQVMARGSIPPNIL